jgi:carboxypeptidase Taq
MPEDASGFRAEQLSWLSAQAHQRATSQQWADALEAAMQACDEKDLAERANLSEMKRRYELATKLPVELVAREAKVSSHAKRAWMEARKENDFAKFLPHLAELVEIAREKAERWGYPDEPYDALLSCHERGATTAMLSGLFDTLRPQLSGIARAAVERSRDRVRPLPAGPYPVAQQMILNEEIARDLGYSFAAGRIDTTTHPFCTTLGPCDVRLTTRYDEADFCSSLYGVLHEAGHGMYEQGLPGDRPGMAAGDAVSLGIHESQSRLWENHVGRSRAFWEKWYPQAVSLFPQLQTFSLDDFMSHVHQANFSLIRVESDEATYDLHIMLRFLLERKIFRNELALADLPAAWNELFVELFGMTPPDDAHGCLQDIHWSMGAFGYFPTYTLGNLHASQLIHAARQDATIRDGMDSAQYGSLLAWLRENIHRHGALWDPAELIRRATGSEPEAQYHLAHLSSRYVGE